MKGILYKGNTKSKRAPFRNKDLEPPDKFTEAIHKANTLALNFLLGMLVLFNIYAQIFMAVSFTVIPDGTNKAAWISEQENNNAPWNTYDSTRPVLTQSEYAEEIDKRSEWLLVPNLIGGFGILGYIGLMLTQPWYRNKIMHRLQHLNK